MEGGLGTILLVPFLCIAGRQPTPRRPHQFATKLEVPERDIFRIGSDIPMISVAGPPVRYINLSLNMASAEAMSSST
jgi:hypothetical protein